MPLNVQITGTATSGRKNGTDYKVQLDGTATAGRKNVVEIWQQLTGTNAADRRLAWSLSKDINDLVHHQI